MGVVIDAVTLGSLYALLAVGLSLVYGVVGIPHFAQAGVVATAALLMVYLGSHEVPFLAMVLLGMLAAGVLAVLIERFAYAPTLRSGRGAAAGPAVALGILMVLDSGNLLVWGAQRRAVPVPYSGETMALADERISAVRVVVVALAVVSIGALQLFLRRTRTGRSIVGVSQDRIAARLMGVQVRRTSIVAFFVSGLLAGAAALAYGTLTPAYPYMADSVILSAFVVIIIGGLGSVPGAIVGGFLVGAVEVAGTTLISGAYAPVYAFVVLLIVLVVKPNGLFGRKVRSA
ncbi:branched-chain amino acid ABC transporter permease [Streptomyces antioxidans]|uniref:Branched-chain amino acid ABC transporter permease n=1 Tax=Streptomyces antioxidans TaxID=1507734 RepID=A0A1V4D245_9ACTN|nr:branched-chain amino acid ABC transporter permease [Streptomyces antioxidans]OPF76915.1 branched-chain amino acid ABC transporter permease [Streptomyces antioxidans]